MTAQAAQFAFLAISEKPSRVFFTPVFVLVLSFALPTIIFLHLQPHTQRLEPGFLGPSCSTPPSPAPGSAVRVLLCGVGDWELCCPRGFAKRHDLFEGCRQSGEHLLNKNALVGIDLNHCDSAKRGHS